MSIVLKALAIDYNQDPRAIWIDIYDRIRSERHEREEDRWNRMSSRDMIDALKQRVETYERRRGNL